ncbi:MAG: DUF4112 domain-containing protein, partial [Pseudomonadota bacterium]
LGALEGHRGGGGPRLREPGRRVARRTGMETSTHHERRARIARLERLAHNMDSRYRVPGTKIRFGWDALLGFIPGLGDMATLGPAGYILLEAHRMGTPMGLKGRMMANLGIDWLIGSIPLVGDLLDIGLKANRRNVALLKEHIEGVPVPEGERAVEEAVRGA